MFISFVFYTSDVIVGHIGTNDSTDFRLFVHYDQQYHVYWDYSSRRYNLTTILADFEYHTVFASTSRITVDGTEYSVSTASSQPASTRHFHAFACKDEPTSFAENYTTFNGTIKYLKVWQNDVLA